jgi:inhibitor of KinA sporulation pathway (predicted exonuclease)
VLTDFCTELTGITQRQVDGAPLFPDAFTRFSDWVTSFDDVFIFSWGNFDKKQLIQDCRRHKISYSLPPGFLDFKNLFFKRQKLLVRSGLEASLGQVGLKFEGRQHSALSDALNTGRLLKFILS